MHKVMLSLELPKTGRDGWTGAESTITLQGFIGKGQVRRRCVRSLGSRRLSMDNAYKMSLDYFKKWLRDSRRNIKKEAL